MSTKVTIKRRSRTDDLPGFHLYDDVLDEVAQPERAEQPVYLRIDGVQAQVETLPGGGASVTVAPPRMMARDLGLLPSDGERTEGWLAENRPAPESSNAFVAEHGLPLTRNGND